MARRLPKGMRNGVSGTFKGRNFNPWEGPPTAREPPFSLFPARREPLERRRAGLAHREILVGHHPELAAHAFQELARRQQEVRIGRLAEALVTFREGLEDQHPA